MFIGISLLLYFSRLSTTYTVYGIAIVNTIIFSIVGFVKIKPQYKQTLEINNKIIFHEYPIRTAIEFDKIDSIGYSGTKIIPMSEMLIIKSEAGIIYVDFNFINYLNVWKDVIYTCKKNNPSILVDKKVQKRLGII
jgi:hypothetical protein